MDRRTFTLSLGAVAVAGGGALLLNRTNGALPGVNPAVAQSSHGVELAPDIIMGDPNAPITVIEYASYTCPHCANFHTTVLKDLKTNYVDTGKVKFIHREVYFDRFGLWAGMIARCGGDMRYAGMNDLIYGNQKDWIGSGDPQEVLANLRKLGRTAGMSNDEMNACLENEDMAKSMVAAYQTNAEADGINATPTLVIDGEKFSNMSYADLSAMLDEKLGG
ncbi:DsbA family protein [Aliiroseovarius subalbicans]|uniref:DsbA family protein n=1 Tax=Aliiroseovarius subalbicans TaxID=2925840 RepID=UPI001F58D49F|nr:DsbA family protein [Aliiroseovarius subalbicans]MCI2400156.1 DsbA family protein [Aliiroseovarius subalbicans]